MNRRSIYQSSRIAPPDNRARILIWIAAGITVVMGLVSIGVVSVWAWRVFSGDIADPLDSGGTAIAIFSLLLTAFTINVGIATIVPYFISSIQIKREVDSIFRERFEDLLYSVDDQTQTNIREHLKTDAHLSRMSGYFLIQNDMPIWGIGWIARSLKRYANIPDINPEYEEFFELNKNLIYLSINKIIRQGDEGIERKEIIDSIERELLKNEERSLRPAIRACKDLIDIIGLLEITSNPHLKNIQKSDFIKIIQLFIGIVLITILERDQEYIYSKFSVNKLAMHIDDISRIDDAKARVKAYAHGRFDKFDLDYDGDFEKMHEELLSQLPSR